MISTQPEPAVSPRTARRRPARRRPVMVAALACAVAGGVWPAVAAGPRQGDKITVTGRVTSTGRPVPALLARLEGSRSKVSVRRLGRVKGHAAQVATTTGAQGEYSLEWEWHDFYNRFDLVLLLRTAEAQGPALRELQRLDVTQRLAEASPVVIGVELEPSPDLERHLKFASSLTSEAQRDAFQEMGPPDRVDRIDLPRHEEITWWYFRTGKAYRFQDGRLDEIVRFEPVESF